MCGDDQLHVLHGHGYGQAVLENNFYRYRLSDGGVAGRRRQVRWSLRAASGKKKREKKKTKKNKTKEKTDTS